MTKEEMLKMQEKYPIILRDLGGKSSETCMSFVHGGISIGDGWVPLIEKLMGYLQFQHDRNGYPQIIAAQIKEKFGMLRFYYNVERNSTKHPYPHCEVERTLDTLSGAISFAELMSGTICEKCGMPGEASSGRWVAVRCKDCV